MTLKEHLRIVLRGTEMSTFELSKITGSSQPNVQHALKGMVDAYVKRYEPARTKKGRPSQIWTVVIVPPNAKPPTKK